MHLVKQLLGNVPFLDSWQVLSIEFCLDGCFGDLGVLVVVDCLQEFGFALFGTDVIVGSF